jgi:hypothetical protein
MLPKWAFSFFAHAKLPAGTMRKKERKKQKERLEMLTSLWTIYCAF